MKPIKTALLALPLLAAGCNRDSGTAKIRPLEAGSVRVEDAFWSPAMKNGNMSPSATCSTSSKGTTRRILNWGGSLARTQATGYGLCYFTEAMLQANGTSFQGKKVVVSGSGNVAIYAAEKATQLGATVIAMSDSSGYIVDENGVNLDVMKEIKEVKRGRIREYADRVEGASFTEGVGIWNIKCDVYLPCATQNELGLDAVKTLIANGCKYIVEGANMPTTLDATEYAMENGVLFLPGKASNAGGVATSALEMSQNSMRYSWTFEEVDAKLHDIMVNIFHNSYDAAKKYGMEGNLVAGANIAGFEKVAEAMIAQGVAY